MSASPPIARGRWNGICSDMRAQIHRGELVDGAMLPSRPELARRYGVALGTLERAITQLVKERLLISENGRGTFVASAGRAEDPLEMLRGRRVGVVCEVSSSASEGDAHWDTNLLRAVEVAVSTGGGSTVVVDRARANGPWRAIEDCCAEALAVGIDALLVIGTGHDEVMADAALRIAAQRGIPLVYLVGNVLSRPLMQVVMDNRDAGRQAANHLIEAGVHTLVCCASAPTHWRDERIAGLHEAARCARKPLVIEVLPEIPDEDLPRAARLCAERIRTLRQAGDAPGLFGINDEAALATMAHLQAMGLRDVPAMGVDDRLGARISGLTTLRPDFTSLGEEASRLLGRAFSGGAPRVPVPVQFRLVRRSSTML